ncbi:uncharacterized protein LOC112570229 [Pomacea canaliculata]|uniref:uncharacterized protein LOC112570229 n=1 Tax=Pomacea canaliculata TaxID=400727 RepID=UPI000D728A6E|nr:uncharacterized protein LOC112570229 [Pomacea canaliculata]
MHLPSSILRHPQLFRSYIHRPAFLEMSPVLFVGWAATLFPLVIRGAALPERSDIATRLEAKIKQLEARLSEVEDKYGNGLTDKVDYGDFIQQDGWVLVFRATSGLGSPVYNAWMRSGYHDDYTYTRATMPCGCTSTNGSCDRHYRSRLLDSWPSSALDKVKLAVYEGGVEKAYMIFTGLGSNYINWFSADRLVESSWKDLKSSAHNYFSILGWSSGTDQRNFYVNRGHGGCPVDIGWLSIKDSGNHCPWETSHQIPAFVYSKSETMINWQGAGHVRGFADVMAVWVKFRPSVNLGQACMG